MIGLLRSVAASVKSVFLILISLPPLSENERVVTWRTVHFIIDFVTKFLDVRGLELALINQRTTDASLRAWEWAAGLAAISADILSLIWVYDSSKLEVESPLALL